jgi:hypothetical protein
MIGPYHTLEIPAARRHIPSVIDLIWWRHWIYGLIEVDVTVIRQFIREYEARSGQQLSLTGYLAYCLARAVNQDKSIQAIRKGSRQLVVFEDVDVMIMMERQTGGSRAPVGHVVRRADNKTYLEINQEIQAKQTSPAPPDTRMSPALQLALRLPWPFLSLFLALLRLGMRFNPLGMVASGGTVGISAVGMFGEHSGWGLAPGGHSLDLLVGGITRRPAYVGERIEPREFLNLTVAFDHDVVDGAPAARFVERLLDLIESGAGLDEVMLAETLQAGGRL